MLTQAGHQMSLYDPVFQPDTEALQRTYDFITCTEVAEHFHQPAQEFDRLNTLLKPGGWLAIMTSFQTDDSAFANWHYRRDPTHVVIYKEETFYWLARHYGWRCEIPGKNVALFQQRHDGEDGNKKVVKEKLLQPSNFVAVTCGLSFTHR